MKTIELILAVLLLLVTLNSTWFFLGVAKVKPIEWLVFNACAPSNVAFLIGFLIYLLTKDRTVLNMALLPVFFFGGLGLYLFPWTGYNLIAQISHVIMTLNVALAVWTTFSTGDYKAAALGAVLGMVVFGPFISFQQTYAYAHSKDMERILGVSAGDFQTKMGVQKD